MKKRRFDHQINASITEATMNELDILKAQAMDKLGREISTSEVIRWILDQYFDISLIDSYVFPKKKRGLFGPEKALAESLDIRNNLSTQLRENRTALETEIALKNELQEQSDKAARLLLELVNQEGVTGLEHSVNLVIGAVKAERQEVDRILDINRNTIGYLVSIMDDLGIDQSEISSIKDRIVLESILNKIKGFRETIQYYMNTAERNLNTLLEVAEVLKWDHPFSDIDTEEKLEGFEKNIIITAKKKMDLGIQLHNTIIKLVNVINHTEEGNIPEDWGSISGKKINLAVNKIREIKSDIRKLEEENNDLQEDNNHLQGECKKEKKAADTLFRKVQLYHDELIDWLAAVSANRRYCNWFRKLFGMDIRINNSDRAYAEKEAAKIQKTIDNIIKD